MAALLKVSRPTISRYLGQGAPQLTNGRLDEDAFRAWVKANVRPHVSDGGNGGHIGAAGGEPDDADEALTEAEIDIAQERARWQRREPTRPKSKSRGCAGAPKKR